MARSYKVLIKQIPLIKTLVENGDADALENLYRNVSGLSPCFQFLF